MRRSSTNPLCKDYTRWKDDIRNRSVAVVTTSLIFLHSNYRFCSKLSRSDLYRSFHGDVTRRATWSSGTAGWQKIYGWRASRVFCRDSFPVCIHFTHTQDHDYVLYWCRVHWALCGWLVLFCYHPKKGKQRKLWLNAFGCKQWGSRSYQPCL